MGRNYPLIRKKVMEYRPWYKRKLFIIPTLALAGLVSLGSLNESTPAPAIQQETMPVTEQRVIPVSLPSVNTARPAPETQSGLSNDNYHTNTAGNQVHSPAYSESIPAGASAKCRDGTYSFSQSRSGTCSHHGGVAGWL